MSDQCRECGCAKIQTQEEFIAERNDIFRGAHGLLKDLGFTPDIPDVLEVAHFLSGDRLDDE